MNERDPQPNPLGVFAQVLKENIRQERPSVPAPTRPVVSPKKQTAFLPSPLHQPDYVNVLVLNQQNEALILESTKNSDGGLAWQIVSSPFDKSDDPLTAVQQYLLNQTGYHTNDWSYLGSYLLDPDQPTRVGYFFCAQKVQRLHPVTHSFLEEQFQLRWIPLKELRYALLDGRIPLISHATTISLALLTILR